MPRWVVLCGLNTTRRGAALAADIRKADCQVVVTSSSLVGLLDDAPHTVASDHVLVVDEPGYEAALELAPSIRDGHRVPADDDLYLLIFTSGSTGMPKAVRCTQGRIGRTGAHVAAIAELGPDDVVYAPLPLFHSASLFTGSRSGWRR